MNSRFCAVTLSIIVPLLLCGIARAGDEFVVTFSAGNPGGWTFGSPNGSIQATGGNPGAFFRDTFLDTFAPQPRTTLSGSPFTGNYRENGVTSVGIDLILFDVDFSAGGRPLTVMLMSNNNTPANSDDDWAAYFIGVENVPLVGEGWKSYDFTIPSASMTLPPGWQTIAFGPNSPVNPDWNQVITNVVELVFFYGDPEFFFIFQAWDLGMDNPRITSAPVLLGDMNCDEHVDGEDIEGFVLAVLDSEAFEMTGCPILAGDFTGNNRVNVMDVPGFVQAVLAGTP